MATQHSVITDPQIHEPKGMSTAAVDTVYVADGAGSGSFQSVSDFSGNGWSTFEDDGGTLTVSTTASLGTLVTNTTLGAGTDETHAPADATSSWWDSSANKFKPTNAGDVYTLEICFEIAATSSFVYGVLEADVNSTIVGDIVFPSTRGVGEIFKLHLPLIADASMVTNGLALRVYKDTGGSSVLVLDNVTIDVIRVYKGA